MPRRRAGCVAGLIATALLLGCSGDDEAGAFDCTKLPVCDIRQQECQARIYRATACAREQQAAVLPPVRSITAEELSAELHESVTDSSTAVPAQWETAFRLFGLAPETPLIDVLIDSVLSNVAAFYNAEDKRITVIEDSDVDMEQASFILSHEFVHALQDQELDLMALDQRWVRTTDDDMALTALIEGEALIHPNVLQVHRLGRDPRNIDWDAYASDMLDSALSRIEIAPSPFIDSIRILPYAVGLNFLIDPWLARGQSAIDELFETPLLSFVDWSMAFEPRLRSSSEGLACFPTGAPPGYSAYDHDSLGVAGLVGIHVALGLSGTSAFLLSRFLHDDSFVVFDNGADPTARGVAVAWRLRLDDPVSAGSLAQAIDTAAGAPFDGLIVEQFDREILVRAAADPALLSTWATAAECGTRDDLPVANEQSSAGAALWRRTARWQAGPVSLHANATR